MEVNVNKTFSLRKLLSENTYPGRGIIIGSSTDGKSALIAYFIMGRSINSRNRIFEMHETGMRTKAFDESKLTDPHLIIYNPYLYTEDTDIITNGDQTDTIFNYIKEHGDDGYAFEKALLTREYEDDAPNFTPRISGIVHYDFAAQTFGYKLSILKSTIRSGEAVACQRYTFDYTPVVGCGHFIHTYTCDGNPIPSFYGEPKIVSLPNSAQVLADLLWEELNEDNKVSLFVRQVPLDGSKPTTIIINKNK